MYEIYLSALYTETVQEVSRRRGSSDLNRLIEPRRFKITLRSICLRFSPPPSPPSSILFKFLQSTKQRSHSRRSWFFYKTFARERNIESRSKGICQAPLDLLQQSRRPLQGVESKTVLSHSRERASHGLRVKVLDGASRSFLCPSPLFSFLFSSIHLVSTDFSREKERKKNPRNSAHGFEKKEKNKEKISRENIIFFFFCFLLTALELDETGIRFKVSWQKWGQKTNYWIIIEGEGKNLSWCKYLEGLKFGEELLLIEEIRTVLVKSFGGKIDPSWECVLKI